MPQSELIDINGLEKDLEAAIEGEIRFGTGDRAMYASDAGNYRMVPIGVILPKSAEDVVEALGVCRSYGAPVVARGGGTGIPGQTVKDNRRRDPFERSIGFRKICGNRICGNSNFGYSFSRQSSSNGVSSELP